MSRFCYHRECPYCSNWFCTSDPELALCKDCLLKRNPQYYNPGMYPSDQCDCKVPELATESEPEPKTKTKLIIRVPESSQTKTTKM